ncbi:MAG: tetratricopeptide repeat protein [Desulfobulbaceae bacterium]|nr:tetratricopeptide repeat protein [Desulfobulbaceae bacterium]
MDWLDKINISVITVLSLVTIGMLTAHELEIAKNGPTVTAVVTAPVAAAAGNIDESIFKDVEALQAKGLYSEALASLEAIIEKHPNISLSKVYLARLYIKLGQMEKAIAEYRKAVEMDPDYVDKKAARFIGPEIKKFVTQSKLVIEKQLADNPDDKPSKKAIKDIYYLQRRLAGGCE